MAGNGTTWPESGPQSAFVLLKIRHSLVVPQPLRRPRNTGLESLTITKPLESPGGSSAADGRVGGKKKRALRSPGGYSNARFFVPGCERGDTRREREGKRMAGNENGMFFQSNFYLTDMFYHHIFPVAQIPLSSCCFHPVFRLPHFGVGLWDGRRAGSGLRGWPFQTRMSR